MEKINPRDKMQKIKETSKFRLYLFSPTWTRLFPLSGHMHKMTIMQTIRFANMKLAGYRVYVLADNEDNVIGEITFAKGGSWKYPFSTKKDLIYGPSYVMKEHRGHGYAVMIGKWVLEEFEKDYNFVYATVREENTSSVSCLKKTGFEVEIKLKADKARRFYKDKNGDHWLAVYKNKKVVKGI